MTLIHNEIMIQHSLIAVSKNLKRPENLQDFEELTKLHPCNTASTIPAIKEAQFKLPRK